VTVPGDKQGRGRQGRGVFGFLIGTFALGVLSFFGMAVYRIATRPHRIGPVNPVSTYYGHLLGDAGVRSTGTQAPAGKSVGNSNSP
jgi:hypothetical protein